MKVRIDKMLIIKDLSTIMLGTFIMALGINAFFLPNQLVTGGVTGAAIIVENLTTMFFGRGIPIWATNLIFNIPLFLLGGKFNGKYSLFKSIFSTVFLSASLYVCEFLPVVDTDFVLASIYGGVLCGLGLGFVFRRNATTGGTDLAATIIHKFARQFSVSQILFMLDSVIIAVGFFIFGAERAMYAVIAVYITSKVIDVILEGMHYSKAAFIISDSAEDILAKILSELERGATKILGEGAYSKSPKNVVLCVVSKKEILELKRVVSEIDKNAFVIVADVREVLGEGFQNL